MLLFTQKKYLSYYTTAGKALSNFMSILTNCLYLITTSGLKFLTQAIILWDYKLMS